MNTLYDAIMLGKINEKLKAAKQTLAVAESVTSGHLQVAFSQVSQAMLIFQGGMTTYNLGQKARQLRVDPIHAQSCNCVSEEVTAQMAREIAHQFISSWGIASTGYASPVPELSIREVYAYYAICFEGTVCAQGKIMGPSWQAYDVQVFFVNEILGKFLKLLETNHFSGR